MTKSQVRPTSKGQVTIPISIRRQLKINPETLLDVKVENDRIVFRPLKIELLDRKTRIYSVPEIDQFLTEDKLSVTDAAFFRQLLSK